MGTNVPRPTLRPPTPVQRLTNCPNCCAVITGPVCEYCGTRFGGYDPGDPKGDTCMIPIYIGNEQVGEAFKRFQSVAYNFGNPARDVKPPSLPIKEQR